MAKKRPLITIGNASQMDWEVEEAFRTLCRAKGIEKDEKLMAKVREFAKNKLQETAELTADITK